MGKRMKNAHSVDVAFAAALFGMFALLSLLLVMIGVRSYTGAVERSGDSARTRAQVLYLSNKVRGGDRAGAVTVREEKGVAVLSLAEDADGERYETLIYCCNGSLMEQFVPRGEPFEPANGQEISKASVFRPALSPKGVLSFQVGSGKDVRSFELALKSR